jgi:hypothetical protein
MKTMKTFIFASAAFILAIGFTSCQKYRKYDNMEVYDNTFSGEIMITSVGTDPAGDFTGTGDSGTYAFVWDNSSKTAQLNYDITTNSGSVRFVLKDAKGDVVLDQTRAAEGDDTFAGVSEEGKKGKWLVEMTLTDFNGDGSFSINPGN